MPFLGFEGPAGTGKTHELVEYVRARIAQTPLLPHQRLLALTFMHGSRRRLDERFSGPLETRGRSSCLTIDSFAQNLIRRWQPLIGCLPNADQFDELCDLSGQLLERPEIAKWVARTFPLVAIDEAQELKPCRLRIVRALNDNAEMFVAADEFQCLDETIDTGPFIEWFETGDIRRLRQVRRTDRQGLLDAAVAIRQGQPPATGAGFNIAYHFPGQMPFSIGHALNNATGSTAILIAPGSTNWANELIPRLEQGFQSARQNIRPVKIGRESDPAEGARSLAITVCEGANDIATAELVQNLSQLPYPPPWVAQALTSIDFNRRALDKVQWSQAEISELLVRKANMHRAYGFSSARGVRAMSIHRAKNRQFRNVVVLWGPGVRGTPEQQRRLLYNAVTRAEHRCDVFVRTQALLRAPPFA